MGIVQKNMPLLVIHVCKQVTLKHTCLKHFYCLARFPWARNLGVARGGSGSESLRLQPDHGRAQDHLRGFFSHRSGVWAGRVPIAGSSSACLFIALCSLYKVSLVWWPSGSRAPNREGQGDAGSLFVTITLTALYLLEAN